MAMRMVCQTMNAGFDTRLPRSDLTPFVSQIHAPDALDGQVAVVTGGGTNLGKAAAAELVRCGASVLIAGRREEVLEAAAEEIGERCSYVVGDIREPADAVGSSGRRSTGTGAWTSCSTMPAASTSSRRGHHRQGLERRATAQRRRHADDVRGRV